MDLINLSGKLDCIFERYKTPGFPGCALAVIEDGQLTVKKSYGLANIELEVPITSRTVFNIGSMSKQFTGFAVALLEAEGGLSLDDDIRQYLPDMADTGHTITIRHLVHHTSGIRDSFPELLALAGWRDTDMTTTEDVLRLLAAQRALNFVPGEEFVYCNSNYVLMAEIVKKVSGMSFADFCQERIFEPLGMADTVVNENVFKPILGRADSYYDDEGTWWYAPVTDSVVGPTNVYTNVEDLAKWDENFYTGEVGGQAVLEQVHTPGKLNSGKVLDYAFGLEVGPAHTHKGWQLVEHGGSQAGYSSWMMRVPDRRLSVVVLFNYFMWGMRDYAIKVLDLLLEEREQPASTAQPGSTTERTPAALAIDQLEQWVGVYFQEVRTGIRQISLKDGVLMYRGNPLAPLNAEHFYFTEMPEYEVIFTPETMTVITASEEVVYKKVEEVILTPEDLKAYQGSYYCPEIDQHWTVTAGAESLQVSRWKYPQSEMKPLFPDAFNDDWMPIMGYPTNYTVIFERDEDGAVRGLKVSGNGVRHLWFEREG